MGISSNADELSNHPELEMGYIIAPPQTAYYMEYSTRVYRKYVDPSDIHIYSLDEGIHRSYLLFDL